MSRGRSVFVIYWYAQANVNISCQLWIILWRLIHTLDTNALGYLYQLRYVAPRNARENVGDEVSFQHNPLIIETIYCRGVEYRKNYDRNTKYVRHVLTNRCTSTCICGPLKCNFLRVISFSIWNSLL